MLLWREVFRKRIGDREAAAAQSNHARTWTISEMQLGDGMSFGETLILLLMVVIGSAIFFVKTARAGTIEGGPDPFPETRSIGDVIRGAGDRPVHLIYVHGMRAETRGASEGLRKYMCKSLHRYLNGQCIEELPMETTSLDLAPYPKEAFINGKQVWESETEWRASRPFVDRYVFTRSGGSPIVVDEVNWWPLLFPIKCRFLLEPESELSGVDRKHLELCARDDAPYFPWISKQRLDQLLAMRPKSGGGAWANSWIKHEILNWGLADAVLAVGPMGAYFRQAINKAFEHAIQFDKDRLSDSEFVLLSDSLGSFVVLDALDQNEPAVKRVMEQMTDLYFFANQVALLDLARISLKPDGKESLGTPGVRPRSSLFDTLKRWAEGERPVDRAGATARRARQIIAFSDPSDMLTFDIPSLPGATVVNIYDRNACTYFGLFARPDSVHTGHTDNPDVLRLLFEPRQ